MPNACICMREKATTRDGARPVTKRSPIPPLAALRAAPAPRPSDGLRAAPAPPPPLHG
jgi:hypothetical protein